MFNRVGKTMKIILLKFYENKKRNMKKEEIRLETALAYYLGGQKLLTQNPA